MRSWFVLRSGALVCQVRWALRAPWHAEPYGRRAHRAVRRPTPSPRPIQIAPWPPQAAAGCKRTRHCTVLPLTPCNTSRKFGNQFRAHCAVVEAPRPELALETRLPKSPATASRCTGIWCGARTGTQVHTQSCLRARTAARLSSIWHVHSWARGMFG